MSQYYSLDRNIRWITLIKISNSWLSLNTFILLIPNDTTILFSFERKVSNLTFANSHSFKANIPFIYVLAIAEKVSIEFKTSPEKLSFLVA